MSRKLALSKKTSLPTSFVVPVLLLMTIITAVSLAVVWGTIQNNQAEAVGGLIDAPPVGTSIKGYWSTAPQGYLLEDGSAVSRSTYAALFAVIGTTFGAGDGSTTFNLPDSEGKVLVAKSSDTEFDTLGETGGEKAHTLTAAEMASHTHAIDHNHAAANTAAAGSHSHSIYHAARQFDGVDNGDATKAGIVNVGYAVWTGASYAAWGSTEGGGSHTHTVNLPAYSGNSGLAGGGGSHNNLQPYITELRAIKY